MSLWSTQEVCVSLSVLLNCVPEHIIIFLYYLLCARPPISFLIAKQLSKVGVMIAILQIKKPRLREVKGLTLAYWLISVEAGFHRTHLTPASSLSVKRQAVSLISTALVTLLTRQLISRKQTQRSILSPSIW